MSQLSLFTLGKVLIVIKAIETIYNGYRFRSRLEARWAVFFDALKIKYEYEIEGYDLGSGIRYLPDFYLPEHDVWVEIKRKDLDENDREKLIEFSRSHAILLFTGDPWPDKYIITLFNQGLEITKEIWSDLPRFAERIEQYGWGGLVWAIERDSGIATILAQSLDGKIFFFNLTPFPTSSNSGDPLCWPCNYNNWSAPSKLMQAYSSARQARFEHGETPVIK